MSKAEAQRVYKLTDKDFDSLTRVVSSLLQRVFMRFLLIQRQEFYQGEAKNCWAAKRTQLTLLLGLAITWNRVQPELSMFSTLYRMRDG